MNFVNEKLDLEAVKENGNEHMVLENRDESIPILPFDKTMFKKLLPGTNYKISISTQVNGTIIAKTNSSTIKFENSLPL